MLQSSSRSFFTFSRHSWLLLLALWVALSAAGYFYILSFAKQESERDLRAWETRLQLTNEKHRAGVEFWLRHSTELLKSLAENQTLQLFLTELQIAEWDLTKVQDGDIRMSFIQNLITATALRESQARAEVMPADAAMAENHGAIAVFIPGGGVVLATQSANSLIEDMKTYVIDGKLETMPSIHGPTKINNVPYLFFKVPVLAIQGDENSPSRGVIAYAMSAVPMDEALFAKLKDVSNVQQTLESVLITKKDESLYYWSPLLKDAKKSDGGQLVLHTGDLDSEATFALKQPGKVAVKRDYRGKKVLVIGNMVEGTSLMLITKVDAAEAMRETLLRDYFIKTGYLFAVAALTLIFAVVWRHASAVRAQQQAEFYRALSVRLERQERLLKHIMNALPQGLFIVDVENRFLYVNPVMSEKIGAPPSEMLGQTMQSVMGMAESKRYLTENRKALETGTMQSMLNRKEGAMPGEFSVTLSTHSALHAIPLPETEEAVDGVLVLEKDLTELSRERERKESVMRKLLETLVMMVDRRDPYAANHSRYVGDMAREVATTMQLDSVMIETAETAGKLMNIGKILIPESILTQKEGLDQEDLQRIRESMFAGANFLEDVPFEGPVVETLRQSQERMDGKGVATMPGASILITARIIAVCNSFVGMASPRAYRKPLSVDSAVAKLREQAGTAFDANVVDALIDYLDRRGGRDRWQANLAAHIF